MKELLIKPTPAASPTLSPTTSSLALGIGLVVSLLAAPAIAQQRPTADANVCSTSTQSCSNAILADGPLSISTDRISQPSLNSTSGSTLEQVSSSVNEQTRLEGAATRFDMGPLEINPGDRLGVGVRTNLPN
ncbi:MAG: hypothetical protein WA947_09805 [Phormidesmis sp.]